MKKIIKYFIVLLILLTGSLNFAQQNQTMQTVHSPESAIVKRMTLSPVALMDTAAQLRLAITLPLRNQSGLTNFLNQLYDPTNSNYHQYLTVSQFTDQFGPTAQDYQAVIDFVRANGLTVTGTSPNRMILDVTGSVATIEKVLHVTMRVYHHPTENRTFYAPDNEPTLNLTVPIMSINGLSNYFLTRPHLTPSHITNSNNSGTNAGSGPGPTYRGYDFRAAYAPGVSLTGTGQSVGLLEFDGYNQSDITTYEDSSGITTQVPLSNVLLGGFNGIPSGNGGEVEVCLDIEMAISMAPGLSKVIVYEAPPDSALFSSAWHDMLNHMATDNLAKQLSCSWYIPGGQADASAEQIFEEMDAQGQSFYDASGDNDAYTGLIDFPGDSPNITQVGGTTLSTSGPDGSYISETVWNWGHEYNIDGVGSGGGISTQYAIPTWQQGINMAGNQGSTTMRNIPDVALTADHCWVYADGKSITDEGGTSFAAPLWAGFTALANQQASNNGEAPVGFINPAIYSLCRGTLYGSDLHDITTSDNTWSGSLSKFYAETGYDLCTGFGSPKGQSLINDLTEAQLFALAYQNQSTYYGASSDNHNRTIARGNNLYEVFSSGGEIFVRQSSNNGSTWNYTTRISNGNGNNSVPSMVVYPVTGTNDTVNVVWESSLGSNYYDIYYAMSGNSGASWSSPILLENSVLVSSYQYGGPQPVITGISAYTTHPPAGPIQPMLPATYMHGLLVVYTSNSGLYSTYEYPGWGWSVPTSISTSAPGSYVWFPSLSSTGGNISVNANLSYDARYYHKIYSNSFDPYTNTWSTEAVVYDGSSQGSYDRQSCIAVTNSGTFDAWNSYNSTYGYYTVKYRMGSFPNTWGTWEWTYPATTANYLYPSVASYTNNGTSYVAITDYSSPGNQVLLHKASISGQTFSTYTISSNASFPNLPNINNDCGNTNPVEVWTGSSAVGNAYQLSISNQNLPKEIMSDENSKITIYQRAISSGDVRVELDSVSATTNQGQDINIPLKSFDYTKDADMSDPWQYLLTEDSTAIAGVSNVTLNLSVTTSNNAKVDSLQLLTRTVANAVTPTELDIYNGGELIYTRTLSGKDAILNKKIEFPIPGGTLLGLKPVIKFSAQGDQNAVVKFSTIENTISTAPNLTQQLASNTVTPTSFNLRQNYPNPFNPSTIISYDIPKSGFVTLKVYDLLGRKITTLYNGNQKAGTYNVSFDASRLSSGVYFYRLQSGSYTSIKKMVLLK